MHFRSRTNKIRFVFLCLCVFNVFQTEYNALTIVNSVRSNNNILPFALKLKLSNPLCNVSTAVVFQCRRTVHISAEQKRRSNIKNGFKTLCDLVPTLKSQLNVSLPICGSIFYHVCAQYLRFVLNI